MRLADDYSLVPRAKVMEFEKRFTSVFGGMLNVHNQQPGNPFYYTFAVTKPHRLSNELSTACTNGEEFVWNPDFLDRLTQFDLGVVLSHEVLHIALGHNFILAREHFPFDRNLVGVAMDFVVNGFLAEELKKKRVVLEDEMSLPQVTLKTFVQGAIRGEKDAGLPQGIPILLDHSLKGKDWKDIYQILEFEQKQYAEEQQRKSEREDENDFPEEEENGFPEEDDDEDFMDVQKDEEEWPERVWTMDHHHRIHEDKKQQVTFELTRAQEESRSLPGSVPGYITDALQELVTPTLDLTKHMRNLRLSKTREEGRKNDWTRFQRRFISQGIYQPRRKGFKNGHFLLMLDTSGSMSDEQIARQLSQIQSLQGWTGIVVPCDTRPHWDAVTPIKDIKKDLRTTQVKGRGGTVFDQFFREFPRKVGIGFDAIIVQTDGQFYCPPATLAPPIPTVWVIDSLHDFATLEVTFGKKVLLEAAIN